MTTLLRYKLRIDGKRKCTQQTVAGVAAAV
jgi:hypothetical protein